MKKDPSQDTPLYIIGWVCILFVLSYFVLRYIFHIDLIDYTNGCVFNKLTGYYCPGCGGTRAAFALLRGNLQRSIFLHPFVPYVVLLGGWFMISQTIERLSRGRIQIALHFRMIYVWIALALLAINLIWKNGWLILTGVSLM